MSKKDKDINIYGGFDIPEDFEEQYRHEELYESIRDNKTIYALTTFLRAIPFNKDGLIEVYRRCLWDMIYKKVTHDKPTVKSAEIVGDVISKWHPHGDSAAYQSIVSLNKDYTNNYPLIFGQGNWSSVLGDPAAAYRYTECKLSEFFDDICESIRPEYVDFQPNFDGKYKEPCYIPFKIPLVLINGTYGIADSYVASILPHNLNDTIELCKKYINDKHIPNRILVDGYFPDLPNYGIILNKSDIEALYKYGIPANLKMKATLEIDRINNRIIIKDLPYNVTRNDILMAIKTQNEKKHAILSKVYNLIEIKTKRNGKLHLEYDIIFDKNSNILEIAKALEKVCLYKTIPISLINYDGKYVHNVTIKDIIEEWYNTLYTTKIRKIGYHTSLYNHQKHIFEGMLKIFDYLDEIISFAKKSKNSDELIQYLTSKFKLTEIQAEAISKMTISQLNANSKQGIIDKINDLTNKIKELDEKLLLVDEDILVDLDFISKKYGRPRRTVLLDTSDITQNTKEDVYPMSNGALLWSYNQYGIFDLQNMVNGKAIMNGLKSIKINGKFNKSINGCHLINNDLIGVMIFMDDNMCRRINVSDMDGMNNWMQISDDPIIKQIVPIHSEDDRIITISKDGKIRKIAVSDLCTGKQAVKVNDVYRAIKLEPNKDMLLIVNEEGQYHYIHIDEIPEISSRTGSGNIIKIDAPFNITLLNSDMFNDNIICSLQDSEESNYMIRIQQNLLTETNRMNKPKQLITLEDGYKITNINSVIINIKEKDTKFICIGKYSTNQFSMSIMKVLEETNPKRNVSEILGVISYEI